MPTAYHRAVSSSARPEPALTSAELRDYEEGWSLFARGRFWHAHESWERIWLQQKDPVRSFIQGLIQLAAAYFLIVGEAAGPEQKPMTRPLPQRFRGALRNFEKAAARLHEVPATYLHVDVAALRDAIDRTCTTLLALGPARLPEFPRRLIPPGTLLP